MKHGTIKKSMSIVAGRLCMHRKVRLLCTFYYKTMYFAKLLPFICLSFSAINCNKSESCPKKCLNTKFIGKNDASIVYKKARGRLGNQLNIYTLLLQLRKNYGYDAYMLQETYDILEKMFTVESLQELPVLEQTFCHHSQMKFQVNIYVLQRCR